MDEPSPPPLSAFVEEIPILRRFYVHGLSPGNDADTPPRAGGVETNATPRSRMAEECDLEEGGDGTKHDSQTVTGLLDEEPEGGVALGDSAEMVNVEDQGKDKDKKAVAIDPHECSPDWPEPVIGPRVRPSMLEKVPVLEREDGPETPSRLSRRHDKKVGGNGGKLDVKLDVEEPLMPPPKMVEDEEFVDPREHSPVGFPVVWAKEAALISAARVKAEEEEAARRYAALEKVQIPMGVVCGVVQQADEV